MPLHASDLLAHEYYKFVDNRTVRPSLPIRKSFLRLKETKRLQGSWWGCRSLLELRQLMVEDRERDWECFKERLLSNPRYRQRLRQIIAKPGA